LLLLQQIPSFLHILYESIIGNHNSVHLIGIGSYGTEVVPKISLWSDVLNNNSRNLINYCLIWLNKKTQLLFSARLVTGVDVDRMRQCHMYFRPRY
jgi:hypothetical protein